MTEAVDKKNWEKNNGFGLIEENIRSLTRNKKVKISRYSPFKRSLWARKTSLLHMLAYLSEEIPLNN